MKTLTCLYFWIVVVAVLAAAVGCGKKAYSPRPEDTLRQLIQVCKVYANPNGYFPPIHPTPGRIVMDVEPEFAGRSVDTADEDFVYLGYAVCTPQNVDLYVDMYRDFAEGRFVPVGDYVRPGTGQTLARLREGAEMYCSANPGNAEADMRAASDIPVILARRGDKEGDKAPVAFMDGHVETLGAGENAVVDRVHEVLPQLEGFAR